jgi:hypothetical protein
MPTAHPEQFRPEVGTTLKKIEDCRLKIRLRRDQLLKTDHKKGGAKPPARRGCSAYASASGP